MPEFPRSEADLAVLVEEMIGWYTTNTNMFTGADAAPLQAALDDI